MRVAQSLKINWLIREDHHHINTTYLALSTRSIIAMIMQVFSQVSRWKWNGTSKQSSCDIMSLFLICLAARNSSYCFSIATRANLPERQTSVNYKSTAIAHIFFIIIWAKMKQRRLTREVVCARRKSAVWMNIFWWKKGISRPIESEGVVLRWRCRRWRQEVQIAQNRMKLQQKSDGQIETNKRKVCSCQFCKSRRTNNINKVVEVAGAKSTNSVLVPAVFWPRRLASIFNCSFVSDSKYSLRCSCCFCLALSTKISSSSS